MASSPRGAPWSYLLVALLYAVGLRGPLPLERASGEEGSYEISLRCSATASSSPSPPSPSSFPLSMGMRRRCLAALWRRPRARRGLHRPGARPNSVLVVLLRAPVGDAHRGAGRSAGSGGRRCVVAAALACFGAVPHAAVGAPGRHRGLQLRRAGVQLGGSGGVARLAPPGRRGASPSSVSPPTATASPSI